MAFSALLHSVSYAGLWGQAFLPLDQFIAKAADLGYDGVMLMAKRPHLSVLDYDEAACARLRALLDRRNLHSVCIAGYTNFTADLEHGEIPQREMQIQHVVALGRLARDLGAKVVRVFTGYQHPAASYGTQWKLVVESLRECSRRVAEWGITIGVQNHHDVAAGWESLHDLIHEIDEPNCKALFDAWAPWLHGADLEAAAAALAPHTVHTTIANYQLRPRYIYQPQIVNYQAQTPATIAVPIEEGAIDYGAFLSAMAKGGFDGTVAYEMCSPLRDGAGIETLDRYARLFVQFLRNWRESGRAAATP